MHPLASKAISEAIPRVIESGFNWLKSWIEDPVEPVKSVKRPRKTRDCTHVTAEQHDEIVRRKDRLDTYNLGRPAGTRKITQSEFIERLNQDLGLNKSKTFYSRIWDGHVGRPHTPEIPQ